MFDLDRFIADCRAAVRQDRTHKAAREVLARANSDPAAILAAQRLDRADTPLLHLLAAQLPASAAPPDVAGLLRPVGEHWIPDAYAADDLLA